MYEACSGLLKATDEDQKCSPLLEMGTAGTSSEASTKSEVHMALGEALEQLTQELVYIIYILELCEPWVLTTGQQAPYSQTNWDSRWEGPKHHCTESHPAELNESFVNISSWSIEKTSIITTVWIMELLTKGQNVRMTFFFEKPQLNSRLNSVWSIISLTSWLSV